MSAISTATATVQIIVDVRERDLIEQFNSRKDTNISTKNLSIGDIIITRPRPSIDRSLEEENSSADKELIIFERKSIADCLASIKDGRYEEQSYRLSNTPGLPPRHNIVYIIEGSLANTHDQQKSLLYGAMISLFYFKGFSVIRTSGIKETAEFIARTANKLERDFLKGRTSYYEDLAKQCPTTTIPIPIESSTEQLSSNISSGQLATSCSGGGVSGSNGGGYADVVKRVKKDNVTNQNISEIMLCQIPGISGQTAKAVLDKFGGSLLSLVDAMRADAKCLDDIRYKVSGSEDKWRKINQPNIVNLFHYFGIAVDTTDTQKK